MSTPEPSAWLQPAHAARAWMRRSLRARIVVLFLGLLLAVQALSFTVIRAAIDRNARSAIADELMVGERLLKRVMTQNAERLTEGATLLAADYGFRAAVNSNDTETIASVLANHGARIGASTAVLLDTRFQLRASAQPNIQALQAVMARFTAHPERKTAETVLLNQKPFQFVMVPMRAPLTVGWVLMGFPIDQHLVDEIHDISALHVSLQVRDDPATPWSTAVSTLSGPLHIELARQSTDQEAAQLSRDTAPLTLAGNEFSARRVVLNAAESGQVSALLMRSVDEAVAPYRQLQYGLAALTVIGVLVFGLGSVLTARHVTTPIRKLAAAAERLGAGDYTTPLGGQKRTDEIGDLAQTFEHMRIGIEAQQQEILKLAYWDSLTSLPNRVQFRNAVRDAIAQAQTAGRSVAVVMLDMDRFKHVNDVLGYRFGDLMLKGVADRLSQQNVRHGDLVARLGGDEFAVLLSQLEPAGDLALARSIAKRLNEAFDGAMTLEDHTVDISASFGIALWPHHAADAEALLVHAEMAMYAAKRQGDAPMMYDPTIDVSSTKTLSLLSELRHAIEHGELRLYLQPKLALDNARILGAEALIRWQHPTRGLLPPVAFILFAEQTGFIRTLTLWVFEEAARVWRSLNEGGLAVQLSVNLSVRDLMDADLPQKFESLLIQHAVPAEAFCLEITESSIMSDPERALATLDRLSGLGFRLSIDDFGTGYSSLAYLKKLPVDELKIDKSFVMTMEKDLDDARIVRSTIDLAHGLGLSVVAEGVESSQTWELLRQLACDEAQGFHMSKPMPSAEFARWCVNWVLRHPVSGYRGTSTSGGVVLH